MEKKIKLIWDFRGPTAADIARHHQKHLQEYCVVEDLEELGTGTHDYSSSHSASYIIIDAGELAETKEILQPHRGEYIQ